MKHFNQYTQKLTSSLLVVLLISIGGCDDDDPKKENTPEVITRVELTFTPMDGEPLVFTATDPDGDGPQDLVVDGPIDLDPISEYMLTIRFLNTLLDENDDGYDVTPEIRDAAVEHMIYFGWTNNIFSSPSGDGNIDLRADAVDYRDTDEDGYPLGLETAWTTNGGTGTFRIVLKHQPALKNNVSGVETGETDVDVTFPLQVQ